MLKQFLAKHFGLVELNELEKEVLKEAYIKWPIKDSHIAARLTALGISFTYNKRTGIK